MRFEGKVAAITGAGTGIGRATAIRFAKEGARVALVDINPTTLDETAQLVTSGGGQALPLRTDVTKSDEVERAIEAVVRAWGQLDVLCNNAGIPMVKPITETSDDDWDRVIDLNLKGVFLGCKFGIRQMLQQPTGGTIVNTASVVGLVGAWNQAAYCASKGGVVLLTKALAVEYQTRNIRVNCVCPGATRTPMFDTVLAEATTAFGGRDQALASWATRYPSGRFGMPEEIAAAITFLASDEAAFVNGHAFVVDGGMSAQ